MQSTNVSDRHLILQRQLQSIVKKTLVATYGNKLVVSVFSARTLNVQQFPSIFSTLKTFEQVVLISDPAQLIVESLVIGMLHRAHRSDKCRLKKIKLVLLFYT